MKITFSPQYSPETPQPQLSVEGDVLTINGEELDFSPLGEGEAILGSDVGHPLLSYFDEVRRVDGQIELILVWPNKKQKEYVTIEVASGPVEAPE